MAIDEVKCVKCDSTVKWLWVSSSPFHPPLCKACYGERINTDPLFAKVYQIRFLPSIISLPSNKWVVRHQDKIDFKELKYFIDECLAALDSNEKNSFLARERDELLGLIDQLEAQIPRRIKPITLDEYKDTHKPTLPVGGNAQMNANAMKEWQIKIEHKYDEYLLQFNRKNKIHNETVEVRHRIVLSLRRELERKFAPKPFKPQQLLWRLLPPEKNSFKRILDHFDDLNKQVWKDEYDRERLEIAYKLGPSATYIGIDEFEWYIVFYFQSIQLAVLECPLKGNALYLIAGDWQTLSSLSKTALLEHYQGEVTRIIHTGDWRSKLRGLLRKRGWKPPKSKEDGI
jgi:hypothetical protein